MITATNEVAPYKTKFSNGASVASIAFSDNTAEKGGRGDGFRPHDLLEAAFACCLNMSARMYADQNSLQLQDVTTTVQLDRSDPENICFRYSVELAGNLSENDRAEILKALQTCPVHKTLSSPISFEQIKK